MAYRQRGLSSEKSLPHNTGSVKVLAAASAISLRQIQKENESLKRKESLEKLRYELDKDWRLGCYVSAEQQARVAQSREIERKRSADKAFGQIKRQRLLAEMLAVKPETEFAADDQVRHRLTNSSTPNQQLKSLGPELPAFEQLTPPPKVSDQNEDKNTDMRPKKVTKSQSMSTLKNEIQPSNPRKVTFMPVQEEVKERMNDSGLLEQVDSVQEDLRNQLRNRRSNKVPKKIEKPADRKKIPKKVPVISTDTERIEQECIELERKLSTVLCQIQKLEYEISAKKSTAPLLKKKSQQQQQEILAHPTQNKAQISEEALGLVEEERSLREAVGLLQTQVRAANDKVRQFEGLEEKISSLQKDNEHWRRWLASKAVPSA